MSTEEKDREQLIQRFKSIDGSFKKKELETIQDDKYLDRVFTPTSVDDLSRIQITIEVVTNKTKSLFDYFRYSTSSVPQVDRPGRTLNLLVGDKTTNKYLGVLQLSTDLLDNEEKDKFLQIDQNKKGRLRKHIRDHIVNMSICVPLQPFGYKSCGGKLLAMLAFSKEVIDIYNKTFDTSIVCIVTTSINGKSVQYDRLKELKFIGYTHGYGTSHIDDNLYIDCENYISKYYPRYDIKRSSKKHSLLFVLDKLKLGKEYLHHGQQRGIYIGLVAENAIDFLNMSSDSVVYRNLKSSSEITDYWVNRWAKNRWYNTISREQIKIEQPDK